MGTTTRQVYFQSCDLKDFPVDEAVLSMCPTARHMINGRRTSFRNTLGGSTFTIQGSHVILKKEGRIMASLVKDTDTECVIALPEVRSEILEKVIDYCTFCNTPEASDPKERKQWENDIIQLDPNTLCALASAAYYLDIRTLVNLASRIIASQLAGKSSEEIQETYNDIQADTESFMFDNATRSRLTKKLARWKAMVEQEKTRVERVEDDRPLEELLEYIDGPATSGKAKKKKNKKPKKKEKNDTGSSDITADSSPREKKKSEDTPVASNTSATTGTAAQTETSPTPRVRFDTTSANSKSKSKASKPAPAQKSAPTPVIASSLITDPEAAKRLAEMRSRRPLNPDEVVWASEDDEDDDEDYIPPEMKAAMDREVEEFRLRLEACSVGPSST
eukprot:Colp12_sorted_trinity150504_noHs@6686